MDINTKIIIATAIYIGIFAFKMLKIAMEIEPEEERNQEMWNKHRASETVQKINEYIDDVGDFCKTRKRIDGDNAIVRCWSKLEKDAKELKNYIVEEVLDGDEDWYGDED